MTHTPTLTITSLHVYPVKSCGGVTLAAAEVGRMGFRYDRQWTFVDEHGMFVAQRESRRLGVAVRSACLVGTAIERDTLTLTAPGMPPLRVPLAGTGGVRMAVQVWESRTVGDDQGDAAAAWATEFLSREQPGRYRLVRMPDDAGRPAKLGEAALAYGDAYPLMVLSEESLADLNARLDRPLPMNRFRPNIVIAGGAPYDEDRLDRVLLGEVELTAMTLCVRCPIPTIDQETAVAGKEPLRTLATYRKRGDGVVFGRNFNHRGTGVVRVGDAMTV